VSSAAAPARKPGGGYVADAFHGRRRPTREVRVGAVGIGGENPIRVQSMTTTDTLDTRATADQAERLADAGCEIVRVTAPSIREAENLREVAAELARRGVRTPLVADIHFTPNAALIAAEFVDKVRVNPGNYADKKKFEVREYSESEYAAELERVALRFVPLVRRCRERGVALRIGTNHGSLSDRIMNRFGDTPLGMVESALEFLDVCESEDFREVVFSMKASNAQVAIQAYRLLAARLVERAPDEPGYPFHVGVTEAGDGEDGRIKSAIGIGALLEDGIGDTIRVSLTEDPVREVPVAFALARRAEARWAEDADAAPVALNARFVADPFSHQRRATRAVSAGGLDVGAAEPVRVELDLGAAPADPAGTAARLATTLAPLGDLACEGFQIGIASDEDCARAGALRAALNELGLAAPLAWRMSASRVAAGIGEAARVVVPVVPESPQEELERAALELARAGGALEWCLHGPLRELPGMVDRGLAAARRAGVQELLWSLESERASHAARILSARLKERGAPDAPIVLRYSAVAERHADEATLDAAIDLGAPLCDGIGDAITLAGFTDPARAIDLGYRVLQGARLRTSRTEYISCPSCGRTLFDLEETTARVKAETAHLKGVKIAVMGCIVNGPGEMADADFGYVGAGAGVVNLYVGKEIVARAVPEAEAPARLVEVIRDHGSWRDQ